MQRKLSYIGVLLALCFNLSWGYSALEDARIIAEYKRNLTLNSVSPTNTLDHALIARKLVHQTNWASVGTISTNAAIKDFPMVNIISINDNNIKGESTGKILFLLTDLDFTGPDWQHNNKATFLFTDEQQLHCTKSWPHSIDPMEPICPRAIISGAVKKMDTHEKEYDEAIAAFVKRHPAAENWLKKHKFYLCELNIKNIFVLDFYGGPHTVKPEDYYSVQLK